MSAGLDALVALMLFAQLLGLVVDHASPDRVSPRLARAPRLCAGGGRRT